MKKTINSAKSLRLVALAIIAPWLVTPLSAAPAASHPSGDYSYILDGAVSGEAGTIPAARPEPPELQRGAAGPTRSDLLSRSSSDPSIRDQNPLTTNGLWETLPGNRVTETGQAVSE